MYAVREEVEVLKEQIKELYERNSVLERENAVLKSLANSEQLNQLTNQLNKGSGTSPLLHHQHHQQLVASNTPSLTQHEGSQSIPHQPNITSAWSPVNTQSNTNLPRTGMEDPNSTDNNYYCPHNPIKQKWLSSVCSTWGQNNNGDCLPPRAMFQCVHDAITVPSLIIISPYSGPLFLQESWKISKRSCQASRNLHVVQEDLLGAKMVEDRGVTLWGGPVWWWRFLLKLPAGTVRPASTPHITPGLEEARGQRGKEVGDKDVIHPEQG